MSSRPHHEADKNAKQESPDGKEITIKPKGFNIVWGNDSRYWRLDENVAELVQVSWLEVTGSTELELGKTYEISFHVSLKPDAFGWAGVPIYMMAKIGKKGRYSWKKMNPIDYIKSESTAIPESQFTIKVPTTGEKELYFGLYEVWSGKWKGGLLIHKATIKKLD